MDRKILLIGKEHVQHTSLIEILDKSDLNEFEIINNPSIDSARELVSEGEIALLIFNVDNIKRIRKFLVYQQRKKIFLPVIIIHAVNRNEMETLVSLGACDIICPENVSASTLTQAILFAIEQKRIEAELRTRDSIMQAINYAAEVFLTQTEWEAHINDVLAQFGAAAFADKVCLYRNKEKSGQEWASTLFGGWSSSDEFALDEVQSETEDGLKGFIEAGWHTAMSRGEIIAGSLLDFPSEEQPGLAKRHIQSVAMVPIFSDQLWWGFITIEHCRTEKNWAAIELETLKTAASIFGAGISRLDAETRLTYLATHDFLTNLPNRMLLEDRFELAIARSDRNQKKFGVITIDLDKFKLVNDTYGHPTGDKVLVEIAWRLAESIRTSDTCARVGGDEFTILAEGINNKKDLLRVMEKVSNAITPPICVEGKEIKVTASMGGSIYPNHGKNMEDLMKAADMALYQVKDTYSGFKIFSDEQITMFKE